MRFPCPNCNSMLQAADEHRGQPATCGFCGAEFTVPEQTTATVLGGMDPGELLARGLNSVAPPSPETWIPPTVEELQRLLPQYEVRAIIGRGGMGAVYKAAQPRLDREVAIKLLPAELAEDPDFVARFEREARTLARLDHAGIIHVHDFGQTPENHLYFVMEFVDGTDLHQLIHGPGMSPAQALEIIGQVCEALQYAHAQGVVHRDIKPANILVTKDGRVKLADFGLARPMHANASGRLTLTRVVMGTPDYMAPEQKRGEGDHRVDLYALGVMLYEMLCRRTPQGAWQPPSQRVRVDVRLDQIVIKAMQEEPELRYQQASEVKSDVESVRTSMRPPIGTTPGKGGTPPPPARKPAAPPAKNKADRKGWMVAAAVLLLGGFAIWLAIGSSGKGPSPTTEQAPGISAGIPSAPATPPVAPSPTLEEIRAACTAWKSLPGWNDNRIRLDKDGRVDLILNDLPINSLEPLAKCRGAKFGRIEIKRLPIDDLSPLAGSTIQGLHLEKTGVSSLKPLRQSGLKSLWLLELPLESLEGLEGASLEKLFIWACKIRNLAPLAGGTTLTSVTLQAPGSIDNLTPLSTHPVRELHLRHMGSLSMLTGIEKLPLETLSLTQLRIVNLNSLDANSLRSLTLDRVHRFQDFSPLLNCPNLRELNHDAGPDFSAALGVLRESKLERIGGLPAPEYWKLWERARISDAAARKIHEAMVAAGTDMDRAQVTQLGDGTISVNLYASAFKNLEILRGAPVSRIFSSSCQLEDLSAAPTLKLRQFFMGENSRIKDYSPLAQCPELEEVELGDPSVSPEPLRGHPNLKFLSYEWDSKNQRPDKTAVDFWKEFDRRRGQNPD